MKKALALLIVLAVAAHAEVGETAPNFTLKSAVGKEVSLSDFQGKVVVLEWTNPGVRSSKSTTARTTCRSSRKMRPPKGCLALDLFLRPASRATCPRMSRQTHASNGSSATAYCSMRTQSRPDLRSQAHPGNVCHQQGRLLVYHGPSMTKRLRPPDIAGAKNYVTAALDEVLQASP